MRKIIEGSPRTRVNIDTLKLTHKVTSVRIVVLSVLMAAFGATAMAQCGGSFSTVAALAASMRGQSQVSRSSVENKSAEVNLAASDSGVRTSIVGLWHIRFVVGNQTIQEAFQIWNAGGTEVHNPNVDPRAGSLCLGTWEEAAPQTFRLAHRVWFYDTSGNFQGTGHLSETLVLGDRGNTHSGTFLLQIYDPNGNLVGEVPGTVVGERISVN